MSDVHGRNINALHEHAKQERSRVDELTERVRMLETTIAQLQNEIGQLNGRVGALMAAAHGTGPTTRG